MKKRLMSMLLVLCMVFTLFPSAAFAEEAGGATIGNTAIGTSSVTEGATYKTLAGAITAAESGDTLQLAADGAPLPQSGLPPAQTETTPTDAMDVQLIGTATVPVTGVKLTPSQITLVAGTTAQLTATVSPDNATNKTLTWESSTPSVATVDSTGLVTAVAIGESFITATAADGSGQSDSCTVTVPNTITTALDFTGKAAQDCTNTTDIGNLHENHTHTGDPCWSWNPDANGSGKGALTLNGINLLVPNNITTPALTVPKDTTIVLTDGSTNLVKISDAVTKNSIGLSGAGGGILTITGSGTLTAQSNQSTTEGSYGIYVGSGSELRITDKAQVNATCASSAAQNSAGIFCDSSTIHISGGAKVQAQGGGTRDTSKGSYGIYCAADDSTAIAVTIEGANTQVEAFGTNASASSRNSNYGIASYGGTKILDGAAVTAKGGTAYKDSIGIYSGAALTIERATVTAIGGTCNNGGTSPASESVGISGNTTLAVTNATVLAQANTCAVRWAESVTCPNASIMASTDGGSTYATPAYLNDTNKYISLTSATTATPAKDVKIMPASYPVTLNNGGTGATGAGSYASGASVSINAGSKSGYTFSGWTSADVTFADASSAATTFTMPDKAVTVTANWTEASPSTKITTSLDFSRMNKSNCVDGSGHTAHAGNPCWAWSNNTLTLNNVDIEVNGNNAVGISFPWGSAVTIVLVDGTENKVTASSSASYSITSAETLTITGTGKLIAACTSGESLSSIAAVGLNITGGAQVTAKHDGVIENAFTRGIFSNGSVVIDGNAKVTASSDIGILATGNLTINSATVNATGTESCGLAANGNISIKGGAVTVIGGIQNIAIYGDSIEISGGTVTATAGAGQTPFNKVPTLSGGMVHKAGTGTWDNTAGTACVYEKDTAATVTTVAVTPETASVQKGTTQQFYATVTGTNNPAQTVTWAVTGGTKSGTTINESGLLTVAADETATSLTVTATSTVDTSKSDTAAVTVTTTPVVKYTVTVTGGTGSGDYEEGADVAVTANAAPAGQRFKEWTLTGMALADNTQTSFSFYMPAGAVSLTAVYEPIPAGTYTVTLDASGGSVSPTSLTVTAGGTATLPTPSRSGSYRFDGWFTAASDGTQYTNSTPINSNVTLYAHWTYTGGGSTGGDGGGSSSGGSSNIIVTPPAPDKPNTPTQAEIRVEGKTDANGNTTISVSDKNITDAIAMAEAEAKKNGNTANGVTIVLSATGGENATQVTVNLPKTVQDIIISKKVVSTIIVVDNPDVQIGMDLKAVTEINAQAQSDVNITATRMDSSQLTGTAQTAIGSRPVFNLAVNYGSGKQVRSFGAGSVSVTIPYTLGADEKAGNVCAVYVDDAGRVQWLTTSVYDSTAKILRFSTNHFSTYGVGYKQDAPAFTDTQNHWATADIEYVVSRGLFAGTGATTFSPNTAMTRGMFVTALGRLANADASGYKTSSFSDVTADSYYMGYIEWANKNGIVNGSDGKFMPDQSITREQMAVIMQNYAKVIGFTLPRIHKEKAFADSASISGYAKDAVNAMQMAGVLGGKSGNVLDPQGTATRAEVSAVLRRFVELRISIDTAQGWTMNDSGKWMYFQDGKPVTGEKDIGGVSYTFDQNGETTDVPKNLSYTTYTVQANENWGLIAQKYGCGAVELARVNNKTVFDVIHSGDVLQVPEK